MSTGFNRVYALDPGTGEEIWKYDPKVDFSRPYSEMFVSRGVAAHGPASVAGPCRTRVFLGTLDARLIAIDAETGTPCGDFGEEGEVDLSVGIRRYYKWDYSVTSPPTVVGQVVVVGSAVGDNGAAELQPGTVRGYDVADGSLLWAWDPLPRGGEHPAAAGWANPERNRTGGANVWSVMAAAPERDLVFLPTTSPSPDFYGGKRLGDNAFANSTVALRASTGEFAWGYVPQSDVPGEQAARTQLFPKLRLHDTDARPLPLWDFNAEHRAGCEQRLDGVRYDGIFTPPSLEGSLAYPGSAGGTNWGSMAYDRAARIGYVAVARIPTIVRLIPREDFRTARRRGTLNGARAQHTEQSDTPYGMARFDLFYNDLPCLEGPWTALVAVDLNRGEVLWEQPLGTYPWVDVGDEAKDWGSLFVGGGPMVTEGGVVFVATTSDNRLRGYDGADGREVWTELLPAGAHATPMGYRYDGADYVVIATGGGLTEGGGRGDHVVAYRLDAGSP